MLTRRQGGVCFEHASLLGAALRALGFEVMVMGGEVWRGVWTPPLTHASVLVSFPGGSEPPRFCDAGYSLRPSEPLPLVDGAETWTEDGRGFRLQRATEAEADDGSGVRTAGSAVEAGAREHGEGPEAELWTFHICIQGEWVLHHRFRRQPRAPPDFASAIAWLDSAGSPFQAGWLLATCRPGAHASLAAGGFAGSSVPPDQAKHVLRTAASSPSAAPASSISASANGASAAAGTAGTAGAHPAAANGNAGDARSGACCVTERLLPLHGAAGDAGPGGEVAQLLVEQFRCGPEVVEMLRGWLEKRQRQREEEEGEREKELEEQEAAGPDAGGWVQVAGVRGWGRAAAAVALVVAAMAAGVRTCVRRRGA